MNSNIACDSSFSSQRSQSRGWASPASTTRATTAAMHPYPVGPGSGKRDRLDPFESAEVRSSGRGDAFALSSRSDRAAIRQLLARSLIEIALGAGFALISWRWAEWRTECSFVAILTLYVGLARGWSFAKLPSMRQLTGEQRRLLTRSESPGAPAEIDSSIVRDRLPPLAPTTTSIRNFTTEQRDSASSMRRQILQQQRSQNMIRNSASPPFPAIGFPSSSTSTAFAGDPWNDPRRVQQPVLSPMALSQSSGSIQAKSPRIRLLMDGTQIRDRSSLKRFLQARREEKQQLDELSQNSAQSSGIQGYSFSNPPMSSSPQVFALNTVAKYAPSLRDRAAVSTGIFELGSDGLEILHNLNVRTVDGQTLLGRARAEQWSERVRAFIAADVLRPLIARSRTCCKYFVKLRRHLLERIAQVRLSLEDVDAEERDGCNAGELCDAVSPTYIGIMRSLPPPLQQLALCRTGGDVAEWAMQFIDDLSRAVADPAMLAQQLESFRQLQHFFRVPRGNAGETIDGGFYPEAYTRSRLVSLARHSYMADYSWNRGGEWRGKPWNGEHLPSDTQLLLHCFLEHIDGNVLPRGSFSRLHFARREEGFKILADRKRPSDRPEVILWETAIQPQPFVAVCVCGGYLSDGVEERRQVDSAWTVEAVPGHSTLFHAIAIFFYHVRRDLGQRLCGTPLASLARDSRTAQAAMLPSST